MRKLGLLVGRAAGRCEMIRKFGAPGHTWLRCGRALFVQYVAHP
jgi:hypothetical protein